MHSFSLVSRRFAWLSVLAALAGFVASMLPARAAELAGLKVGDQAPVFELKDQAGATVKLADLLKRGPVAVVFYRSADW